MENKKGRFLTILITAIITFLITIIVFISILGKVLTGDFGKLTAVRTMLEEYSLFDLDEEKLIDYAAIGMAASVEDPYTTYFPKEEFTSYTDNIMSSYVGVGVTIGANVEKNQITVISTVEDGPAHKAGMKAGDVIVAVDGKAYEASRMTEATMYIKNGEIGTTVTITVERDGKRLDLKVMRDKIVKKSVESRMLENKTGYIKITSFDGKSDDSDKDTYDEFCQHIEKLNKSGFEKLIIDLRDNPGGEYSVVCRIVDAIVPEGIITYTEDKKGKKEMVYSDSDEMNIPIVVLVNGGSASASEILTGALKDYKKATIIGTKTYGKGIVQRVFPFSDGSGMSITVSKYYTPSGVCIHEIGIEPDVVVERDSDTDLTEISDREDNQLQEAIEFLNK